MFDHGLDGAAASEFAFGDAEDAVLLAGDEDAAWIGRAVTTISLVDIGTLDLAAGKPFGVFDHDAQRVAIIGVAGGVLACSTNWPPGARALVVAIEALTPNS